MSNGSVRLLDDAVGGSRAIEKGCLDEGEEIRDAWIWRKGADENITSYIICLVQNSLVSCFPVPRFTEVYRWANGRMKISLW